MGLSVTLGATYGDCVWVCCNHKVSRKVPISHLVPGDQELDILSKDLEEDWSEYQRKVLHNLREEIVQARIGLGLDRLEEALSVVDSLI